MRVHQLDRPVRGKNKCYYEDEAGDGTSAESVHFCLTLNVEGGDLHAEVVHGLDDAAYQPCFLLGFYSFLKRSPPVDQTWHFTNNIIS